MPDETTTTQKVQIGVEATPGTPVAATKRLLSLDLSLGVEGDINTFRPSGSKYPSVAAMGKEWSGGDVEGWPTYTELLYIISNLLGPPTTSTPGGATLAREHAWRIKSQAAHDPQTWTVEKGSSSLARKSAHGIFTELGMTYNRDEISLDGTFMAQLLDAAAMLTALTGADELALIPVLPREVSIYLDTTAGAIGTTKLLRVLEASWSLGDQYTGLWPLDAAQTSFATTYEGEPSSEVGLTLGADAVGYGLLAPMRAGDTRYLRIEAIGGEIEAGQDYEFTADFAVKVTEVPGESDDDGLETLEYGFELFHDSTWGDAGGFVLRNALAAL
jgi:hypothetical protein